MDDLSGSTSFPQMDGLLFPKKIKVDLVPNNILNARLDDIDNIFGEIRKNLASKIEFGRFFKWRM